MLWEVGELEDAFNVKKSVLFCNNINFYPAKLRKLSLRAMAVRHLGQR